MSKIKNIFIGISFIILVSFLTISYFTNKSRVYIKNNTNEIITNLKLQYYDGKIIATIPEIKAGSSKKYVIDTSNLEGDSSIYLTYKDATGKEYNETIIGYLQRGYSENATVSINNIDNEKKLEFFVGY
jgi:hypothetical protein